MSTTMTDSQGKVWTLYNNDTGRYTLRSLVDSARRYGDCEVCSTSVDETTFLLSRQRVLITEGDTIWTCALQDGARPLLYGHEACLRALVEPEEVTGDRSWACAVVIKGRLDTVVVTLTVDAETPEGARAVVTHVLGDRYQVLDVMEVSP